MKRCHYCGKEAEDTTEICPGCGTPLHEAPASPSAPTDLPPIISKPILNAARATQIFVIMFVAQIVGAMVGGAIVVAFAAAHGADFSDSHHTAELVNTNPLTFSAAAAAGAIATIAGSLLLVRPSLKDISPAGAAWVLGSRKDLLKGLSLGVVVALGSIIINTALSTVIHPHFGPLTKMGLTPGISQVTYVVLALLVFPVPEELLFRGVMYGGYVQSFGPRKAMLLTTAIFLLMHFSELIHFLPAALGILGLALAALYMRLRASAIGPAVAVHFAYNLVVCVLALIYPLLQSQ